MSVVVFISHSHDDRRLAAALVTLLNMGAGIDQREIRCTSFAPSSLKIGSTIAKTLRKDLKNCNYFIPLITRNVQKSEFFFFEIGGAWVLEMEIVPVIFKLGANQQMPAIFSDLVAIDLTDADDVTKLATTLNEKIWKRKDQVKLPQINTATKVFMQTVRRL
jgi:hypothetical protein